MIRSNVNTPVTIGWFNVTVTVRGWPAGCVPLVKSSSVVFAGKPFVLVLPVMPGIERPVTVAPGTPTAAPADACGGLDWFSIQAVPLPLAKHGLELVDQLYDSIELDCPDHRVMVV